MRNLLAFLALVLLALAVTGSFRGWYRVESLPAEPGRSAFRIEIDRSRMADDFVSAGRAVFRTLSGDRTDNTTDPPGAK
jgi:hypothetical protein